jgi:uncharacterized repeat protein (TIGR03803 family)
MKTFLACVAFFGFTLSAVAQAPSTPPISQLFGFYCNGDYSSCPDGFQPALGPIQLSDGNFYGTTWYGNTDTDLGTVWQATPSGDVNVLYTFTANGAGQYANGSYPATSFLAGPNDTLYGVTLEGGANNSGVFYSITTAGSQQVLYNFCSLFGCLDSAARVVLAGDGNFYGITPKLVFKLTPEGVWSQFYPFPSSQQGLELIAGTDGNLYGVKAPVSETNFRESIFRLTTAGVYSTLRTFPKEVFLSALIQNSRGILYGVSCCGANTGIFQISPAGTYRLLQATATGALPPTLLVPGSDDNLYGLIANGSEYDGFVFAVSPKGKTLFSEEFNCLSDGCDPLTMIEASDGNFYGLTAVGGTVSSGDNSDGTIFKVTTGLKGR